MAVTITVDSVDITSSVIFNSMKISSVINQQVDNLNFVVRKYGSLTYVPGIGDEVVVTSGSDRIFGGVIMRVQETIKASNILEYTVTCNDYSQFLKRELVTERYENQTLFYIINDIITTYTSGFTVANVVTGPTFESISFNRLTVAECLQKIADALSYVWYVDYDKDIHFFPKNTELAPFNLSDSSGNYIYNSLEIIEDITQLRNTVLVQGGESISGSTRTETYTADGTKAEFPLANKFSEKPAVTVNGVAQTVGTEYLDDESLYECMWNFNEKYIRFTTGNVPANTNDIAITGLYLIPIIVRVNSPASVLEFGVYEFTITDKSISSQDEAINRALAELESYQNKLYDGKFRTYNTGLRSGQVININSTQRNKNIDVLIQNINTVMRDPLGVAFEYEVTFATLKNIGIIEYLQKQLRDREIIVDDLETLLNLNTLSDTYGLSDSLDTPSTNSPPYVYGPDAGNVGKWNFSTWS